MTSAPHLKSIIRRSPCILQILKKQAFLQSDLLRNLRLRTKPPREPQNRSHFLQQQQKGLVQMNLSEQPN